MLFATNRVLKEGPTPVSSDDANSPFPRSINFDLENNQAEQSIYFCQRHGENHYSEIGHEAFFNALYAEDSIKDIVFYVHGFSNLPESSIFPKTEELQKLFDELESEPGSRSIAVIPLIWPCDNDFGILKDYFDDQIASDASDLAFMRFFEWYFNWLETHNSAPITQPPFNKHMHILSHSMGARVIRGALNRSVQFFQRNGFPLVFRNVFLAAADLVNEALEPNEEGQWIPISTRNVVVYYASDDWALRSSQFVNIGNLLASKRLGQRGPENFRKIPRNVFAFDCGDFNTKYDPIIGHGYFSSDPEGNPGLVLRHMQLAITSGRITTSAGSRDTVLSETILT